MNIEVDQSGKIERTREDTVLAFSDGKSGSVRIPAAVKRGMFLRLAHQNRLDFDKEQIVFRQIGKRSAAHFKAYGVYQGVQKADRVLTVTDILSILGHEKRPGGPV